MADGRDAPRELPRWSECASSACQNYMACCNADNCKSQALLSERGEHPLQKTYADGSKLFSEEEIRAMTASPAATPSEMIDREWWTIQPPEEIVDRLVIVHQRALAAERESAALRTEVEALKGRLAEARRTSEYWKAEHNAANETVEAAESALSAARASGRERVAAICVARAAHIKQNGINVAKYGGEMLDEGRIRQLCATYLIEFAEEVRNLKGEES